MAIIQPSQLATGSYSLSGSFSGSFQGNGSGLNNIPSSAIVGLSSTQIANGNVTASVSTDTGSFTVTSGSNTFMFVSSSGNVGIGISTPAQTLVVNGIISAGSTNGNLLTSIGGGVSTYGQVGSNYYYINNLAYRKLSDAVSMIDFSAGGFIFKTAGGGGIGSSISFTSLATLTPGGNLLINTTTDAGYKLDVNGVSRVVNSANTSAAFTATNTLAGGIAASFTTAAGGSVQFQNGYIESSALQFRISTNSTQPFVFMTQGTERMRLAPTTGNVLINTTTDTGHKLTVSGSGASGSVNLDNTFYVSGSNVGVGTVTPAYRIDVLGNVNGGIAINSKNSSTGASATSGFQVQNSTTDGSLFITSTGYTPNGVLQPNTLGFYSNGIPITLCSGNIITMSTGGVTERLRITSTGNVLISTTADSGYKLDVNGTARVVGQLYSTTINLGGNGNTLINYASNSINLLAVNAVTSDIQLTPFRQVNINNTGTYTAQASAILQTDSTTKGFLPPRMTGAQAELISSPAEGLMVYATDGTGVTITSKGWWGYDGATWVKLN